MRIATWNLWGETEPFALRLAAITALLRRGDADALLLQEVAPDTARDLAAALSMHAVAASGLAVLSKIAPARTLITPLPGNAEPRFAVTVEVAGIAFHSTHLEHRAERGDQRALQVDALRSLVHRFGGARHVLGGDMNATPDAPEMHILRTTFEDVWAQAHPGQDGFTWCAQHGEARAKRTVQVQRRIDYLYISAGQGRVSGATLDGGQPLDAAGIVASDHFALFADVW